jgi:hypothetical protein
MGPFRSNVVSNGSSKTNGAAKAHGALPPMDQSRKEIRLLRISPGKETDPISCKITVARLGKWGLSTPKFVALSYAWGDVNATKPITVNGAPTNVPVTLEAALRQLRAFHGSSEDVPYKSADGYIWIDYLCTNQADVAEKAYQVTLISDILNSAARVVVWIGDGTESSDTFMDWVQTVWLPPDILETLWRRPGSTVRGHLYLNRAGRARLARNTFGAQQPSDDMYWLSFSILSRPWFRQVWTVQESSIVKKDPIVICGTKSASLLNLAAVLKLTHDDNAWMGSRPTRAVQRQIASDVDFESPAELLQNFHAIHEKLDCMMNMRLALTKGFEPNFEQAMDWTSKHLASNDPREKIYGFLGVLNKDVRSKVKISYQDEVPTVATQAILAACESYAFLNTTSSYKHRFERQTSHPSWLPDLEGTSNIYDESFRAFEYNWQGLPRISASKDHKTIDIAATMLDAIDSAKVLDFDSYGNQEKWKGIEHIADIARSKGMEASHPLRRFRSTSDNAWSALLLNKEIELLGEWESPNGLNVYQSLWKKLIQGYSAEQPPVPENVDCFTDWWWDSQASFAIFAEEIQQRSRDLSFICTSAGFIGVGPKASKSGDEIVILHGMQSLALLRPKGNGQYTLLGPVFVLNVTGMFAELEVLYKKKALKDKTVTLV